MSFTCKKEEFDRCFNRLNRPVEESRPDRFPSLVHIFVQRKQEKNSDKKLQF